MEYVMGRGIRKEKNVGRCGCGEQFPAVIIIQSPRVGDGDVRMNTFPVVIILSYKT